MPKYTFKEIVSKCDVKRNIKEGEKVEAACPVCGSDHHLYITKAEDGKVLAYDELVYAVNVSDSGSYSSKKEKNQTVNSSILKTLELIKENGDSYQCDFGLDHNDNSGWFYTVSESARPGFIRDCFGVATIDELKYCCR